MIFAKSKKSVAWIIASVFALTMLFTATAGFWNIDFSGSVDAAIYDNSGTGKGIQNDIDYIADRFDLKPQVETGGHVFDVLSFARLNSIMKSDGKSIFVLASSRNETSYAALPLIDEAARAYGIEKIYYFDVHLSAEYGSDFTNGNDMTMDVSGIDGYRNSDVAVTDNNANWTDLWSVLKTYAQNSAFLKFIDEDFESDDTYLFIFDRAGGNTQASIVSDLLIDDVADCANANTFKTSVTGVFNAAGWTSGNSAETTYSNYDFFMGWANDSSYRTVDMTKTNFPDESKFRLRSTSFYEYMYILDQPGERLMSINGSWCGDSKSVIGLYAEYSIKYNTDSIYILDMALGNSANGARAYSNSMGSYSRGDQRSVGMGGYSPNGTAYLGQMLVDKLGPYEQSPDNGPLAYHPDGDPSQPIVYGTQQVLRSPTLWRYNRDHTVNDPNGMPMPQPVIDIMMHRSEAWETQSPSAGLGSGHNPEGTLSDLEFNSRATSATQSALARARLAVFFGAPEITYGARNRMSLYSADREKDVDPFDSGG